MALTIKNTEKVNGGKSGYLFTLSDGRIIGCRHIGNDPRAEWEAVCKGKVLATERSREALLTAVGVTGHERKRHTDSAQVQTAAADAFGS